MSRRLRPAAAAATVWLLVSGATTPPTTAQGPRGARQVSAGSIGQLREWDRRIDGMLRTGELRVRDRRDDTIVAGRTHERADQFHDGVRVFGGDVARQLRSGQTVSVFGTVYEGIAIETTPALSEDRAREIVAAETGADAASAPPAELTVLPLDRGGYALTWRLRAGIGADIHQYFVDARTGTLLLDYSDVKTQTAVGLSHGVLGDVKKISAKASGGQFVAEDARRPPQFIRTYDMQGNTARVLDFIAGRISLSPANDIATDADNDWSDGAVVDAHVYAGYTYDYLFHRFKRRGLNNLDLRMISLVHPVRRTDTLASAQYPQFFANAGYYGGGVMIYGVGLPPGVTAGGRTWDFMSGAIDIVAHELAHGVTDFTSDLIYRNESGALNEAFSDIMGTSVEFYFQPPGTGSQRADYLCGEDIARPGGIRSLADPRAFGHPDHYSIRFTGVSDNGGIHINSGIANHAFYLAIEGGANRTSGLGVQGVGAANREQIETVFFRAFTEMLPSNATFATARGATIQAARDLYGASSPAERAVTQAWTAVGVD